MTDLLARLESGSGSDRATDGAIWCAAAGHKFDRWDGAGVVYFDEKAPAWDRGRKHRATSLIPEYTGSLDAALSLVERMLPGWGVTVYSAINGRPARACLVQPEYRQQIGENGASMARALTPKEKA